MGCRTKKEIGKVQWLFKVKPLYLAASFFNAAV